MKNTNKLEKSVKLSDMSINSELASLLSHMAQLMELLGVNRFKISAYQRGARRIKELAEDLESLAKTPEKLTEIDGIGKGLAEKIVEFSHTKKITEYDELLAQVPAGVLDVMNIPGVGPKTAALLWRKGNVESLADLKTKIASGELEHLPRMGKKTLENIAKSIAFTETASQRMRIGVALPIASYFVEQLENVSGVKKVNYAGSLRRGKESIGDIDLLVACDNPAVVTEKFTQLEPIVDVLLCGETKTSVRINQGIQVDLRVVSEDQFGAALAYFTGSKEHNVAMRQRAIARNLRLNEYGLWKTEDADKMFEAEPVAASCEEDIYQALDLPFIPPELREDRHEITIAEKNQLPKLIQCSDIRCDLHTHTTASDGVLSIEEIVAVAKERGFHTLAITDHSKSQAQAHGLDANRLESHIEHIRTLNAQIKEINILAGSEVDILADGKLDYPNSLLKELDIVIASPHAALTQDSAKATKRLLKAIDNPYVHVIGHPTGRLIGRRDGLNPNMAEIFKAAAQTGTALELNANPWRLDLRDVHLIAAVKAGCMISINTDAHRAGDFDLISYGIATARRGWVEPKHVINCYGSNQLQNWLHSKRNKMG